MSDERTDEQRAREMDEMNEAIDRLYMPQVAADLRAMVQELLDDPPAWFDAPVDEPPPDAPPPGSDADTWLEWRAKEKAKRDGTWYRLEQLAKWSGYTIAQLKYKSSLRKPRGTPKPALDNKKKLNG